MPYLIAAILVALSFRPSIGAEAPAAGSVGVEHAWARASPKGVANGVAYPQGLAVDANDNLFIGDYSNRVRWVSPNGIMTTIAGTGSAGYSGDGGSATAALLSEPTGVALDSAGDVLVSDYNLLGADGLKDRTGLLEHRYDPV